MLSVNGICEPILTPILTFRSLFACHLFRCRGDRRGDCEADLLFNKMDI